VLVEPALKLGDIPALFIGHLLGHPLGFGVVAMLLHRLPISLAAL
jgi:hypothetical protein